MDKNLQSGGIIASYIPMEHPPLTWVDNKLHGPPGAFIWLVDVGPSNWILACPGCGKVSSPKNGAKWTVEAGSFENIQDLTLRPSLVMNCCGWHGWLTRGLFHVSAERQASI